MNRDVYMCQCVAVGKFPCVVAKKRTEQYFSLDHVGLEILAWQLIIGNTKRKNNLFNLFKQFI